METVIINDIDITDSITSFEWYDEFEEDKLIGNASSTQIKLTLINKDNQLSELLDYPFIIAGKKYLVYGKPERWTQVVSLTLYDQMILANKVYNTQLQYPATVSDQLDEISDLIGVEIDKTTLSSEVLSKQVNWYDNSELMRSYIAFIAECDGKNALIENDKLVFRKIGQSSYTIDFCSNYVLNELLTFSRVCYENEVADPLESGDASGKTLYLNPKNSYIEQSDVDRVYSMYNGLSFYSFSSFDCLEIEGLKLTDFINYYDITILPLSIKRIVNGGSAKDSLEMSADITLKNVDDITIKEDPILKIKRIKTTVDQNAATLQIVAQQSDNNADAIGELILTTEEFKITIEKVEELETKIPVSYYIDSSLGYSFLETSEDVTTLTARIFIGSDEYDSEGNLLYTWYLVNEDGTETVLGTGKSIELSVQTLGGKGVYFEATDAEEQYAYTVPDVAVAIRQNVYYNTTTNLVELQSANTTAVICCTTENNYVYTDRESNTVYLMPVPEQATKVSVTNNTGIEVTARFRGYKDNGGTLELIFDSSDLTYLEYEFEKESCDYMTVELIITDGTSWPWEFDDSQINVMFTNY